MDRSRPLSPHLSKYRWEVQMSASILHRASGIALTLAPPALSLWIASVAAGGGFAAFMQGLIGSWFGWLALFGWSLALSYHLLNGLRHLGFDIGFGFAMASARRSGWAAILGALALTLAIWAIILLA